MSHADHRPSEELLEATHSFPGVYKFKAIGSAEDDFVGRVLAVVEQEVAALSDIDHSVRETPQGRHVSLTLDVSVQSAAQVRTIYSRILEVNGLVLLF